MAGIFISYRHDEDDLAAGRLADDLAEVFGPESIFRDIENLQPGEDYAKALDHALDSCVVLIAVIGPRWATITDSSGRRRLENSWDWVRIEIGRALQRGVRVIPALLSGTPMPGEDEVPFELRPLLRYQAWELGDRHWKEDMEILVKALAKIPGIARMSGIPGSRPAATSKVKLIGSKQKFLINPQIGIFIDGKEAGRMKLSDQITIDAEPGTHNIFAKMPFSSSNTEAFDLKPGQTQTFSLSVHRLTGQMKIEPSV